MKPILIVEDEFLLRALLEEILTANGFEVSVAESVRAAIPLIDRDGSNLTVLITDIQLGDRATGWDIARHARSANAEIHVIYMSGTCGDDWPSQSVPNSLFIQKPFAMAQIEQALASLFRSEIGDVV